MVLSTLPKSEIHEHLQLVSPADLPEAGMNDQGERNTAQGRTRCRCTRRPTRTDKGLRSLRRLPTSLRMLVILPAAMVIQNG